MTSLTSPRDEQPSWEFPLTTEQQAVRPGRPRNHARDPEILAAALDVLAESGYDGMTIDMVAARAKAGKATLYRRWPSKAELVVEAVGHLHEGDLDDAHLPDTGSLRDDLIALIRPHTIEDAERKLQVTAGVISMLSREPGLADAISAVLYEPRVKVIRALMRRAADRGEIAADCDIETLSLVTPAMVAHRVLFLRQPVDRDFLISLIDGVLLPAAGLPRS
jgi:AcrR family transcriptional regulator